MAVAHHPDPSEAKPVDDARVVEIIREGDILRSNDSGNRADVCLKPGRENQGVVAVFEGGDAFLKASVEVETSSHEARRPGADAVVRGTS